VTGAGALHAADGGWGEFEANRLLLVSAFIGLTASMNAVMIYSLGSFIDPLNAEFGWDRSSISLAVLVLTFGVFLAGPVVGRLADRFGAAAVGALSLLAYGLIVLTMSLTLVSFASLLVAYFLVALAGAGSTPIVLVRPITARFDRRRGIALGIALTGAGLAGFWVPIAVTEVTTAFGWQAGYWVIAACAFAAAPVVWFGFGPYERQARVAGKVVADEPGLTLREARRTPAFWLATLLAIAMALGIGGLIVHLIPLFKDFGVDARTAARLTAIIGIASAVGRLVIGLALDRFSPRLVTTAVLVMGASGVAMLTLGTIATAALAVMLIGLLLGAELDLLAYLASRRFGQKAFGAIYGWLYSMYALGFGLSPFLIGLSRDTFGSYDVAVMLSVGFLVIAALAAQGLRPANALALSV